MASRVLYAVTWSKAHWYIHRDGDIRPQDRKKYIYYNQCMMHIDKQNDTHLDTLLIKATD